MDLLIGERIKKYRKNKEMTQDALAQALMVSPQSISKWECGTSIPDIENLCAMAELFNVSLETFIGSPEKSRRRNLGGTQKRRIPTAPRSPSGIFGNFHFPLTNVAIIYYNIQGAICQCLGN